jgi:hypothetical protein
MLPLILMMSIDQRANAKPSRSGSPAAAALSSLAAHRARDYEFTGDKNAPGVLLHLKKSKARTKGKNAQ